jgi:hypothetical protein
MQLQPFYGYDVIAWLERRSRSTIESWLTADRKLPIGERRFPGAFEGNVPLADIKARYGFTNDDIKAIDVPEHLEHRSRARASA